MMPEIYDPKRALTEDWRTYFLDRRDEMFILPCEDGNVELNGRWMLLNIMLTMPLTRRYRPINGSKHLITSGIYDASRHAKCMTQISRSLEEAGYSRRELGQDIIRTVNDAHNMTYTHLGQFIRTMDIFTIADTILQDDTIGICTMDYGDISDGNINRMETEFKKRSALVIDLLSGDSLKTNIFRAPLLCGALKIGQFTQFVLSAGPRTDTDDHIFLRPVVGSFLSGMFDIKDLAIESRSASKATHYNKTQMPTTQYQNRKIHIQNSVIEYLYEGDCGADVYVTYTPTKRTVKHFVGKYFLSKTGELVELTEDKFDSVIDCTLQFRDVPTCRYSDGYCEVCGGTLTRSFEGMGNVGFLSNVNTGAPVAQQVLSTKHLISTDAAEYEIPGDLVNILMSVTNDIFLRPAIRTRAKSMAFGFQPKDLAQLNDLRYFLTSAQLPAERFTNLKYISIGQLKPDGTISKISNRVSMSTPTKVYPHLSPEVLHVLRQYPQDVVEQDGIAWLILRNVDVDKPVMQCTVVNNSIKRFVSNFSNLVTRDIERYHSINDFMRDLTSLIWPRVDTHITHMSCLVKACLITSRKDFNVPVVTDPDNVMFGTLHRNVSMRSIGGLLAFERYNQVTNKPATYITPRRHSVYDEFMGTTDLIERDKDWPPLGNRPEVETYA